MGRYSLTDGSDMGFRRKCQATTGELELYAPYMGRETNCNVAIIEESTY
jgi:hypothetical protein